VILVCSILQHICRQLSTIIYAVMHLWTFFAMIDRWRCRCYALKLKSGRQRTTKCMITFENLHTADKTKPKLVVVNGKSRISWKDAFSRTTSVFLVNVSVIRLVHNNGSGLLLWRNEVGFSV